MNNKIDKTEKPQAEPAEMIMALFAGDRPSALTENEIISALGSGTQVRRALEALTEQGSLLLTRKGKYATPQMQGLIPGTFWSSGRGFGFVSPDGGGEDLFIPPKETMDAWHTDRVLVTRRPGREGKGPEGAVQQILSRGAQSLTGRLVRESGQVAFVPDNKRMPDDIRVARHDAGQAKPGDRVAVRILSYGTRKEAPRGEVTVIFGRAGTREAACAAVLHSYGVRTEFAPEAIRQAQGIPQSIQDKAAQGRRDLRDKIVFTIDGADAKDLDDAVSLEKDEQGRLVLGVHIADVSHYVTEGSPLDKEALARGTSVYYADKVIPMLPEALSNGICSLNGKQERLTLSAFMTLDKKGKVLEAEFAQSVICSVHRMTYADCNTLLAGTDAALAQKYADILPMLKDMAALAEILYRARIERGGLDIETVESYIKCDEQGRPVDVLPRKRGVSEKLIEEFMLRANESVARYFSDREKPAVYRVHEKPDPDKIAAFAASAGLFGYQLGYHDDGVHSADLQKVLEAAQGKPEQRILSDLLLRSMMKARYSESNLGHFGLAAPYYCHFTSPIRRYPDLVVHRVLTACLQDKMSGQRQEQAQKFAAQAAKSSSDREVAADNTERDIEKLYKAEYMQGHIGQEYAATVSGVQPFGLFVQLENTVEGLIPIDTMEGDYFAYDEKNMALTGVNSGRKFRIGVALRVLCVSADPSTGEVDFILKDSESKKA